MRTSAQELLDQSEAEPVIMLGWRHWCGYGEHCWGGGPGSGWRHHVFRDLRLKSRIDVYLLAFFDFHTLCNLIFWTHLYMLYTFIQMMLLKIRITVWCLFYFYGIFRACCYGWSIILCVRANVSKVYDIYLILYPSLPHLLDIFFLLLKPGIKMIW